jgi:hypothetical protein
MKGKVAEHKDRSCWAAHKALLKEPFVFRSRRQGALLAYPFPTLASSNASGNYPRIPHPAKWRAVQHYPPQKP